MKAVREELPVTEGQINGVAETPQPRVPSDIKFFQLFFKQHNLFRRKALAVLFCHHKKAENLSKLPKDVLKLILIFMLYEVVENEARAIDTIRANAGDLVLSPHIVTQYFKKQFGITFLLQFIEMVDQYGMLPSALLEKKVLVGAISANFRKLWNISVVIPDRKYTYKTRKNILLIPKNLFDKIQNIKSLHFLGGPIRILSMKLCGLKSLEFLKMNADFLEPESIKVFQACRKLRTISFFSDQLFKVSIKDNGNDRGIFSTQEDVVRFYQTMPQLHEMLIPKYWFSEIVFGKYEGLTFTNLKSVVKVIKTNK